MPSPLAFANLRIEPVRYQQAAHPSYPEYYLKSFFRISFVVLLVSSSARSLAAQLVLSGGDRVEVNSELEEYLRFAATMDSAVREPWSIRGFTPTQVRRLTSLKGVHPWSGRIAEQAGRSASHFEILPLSAGMIFNSSFPFGSNDGPVWAGKGLTSVIRGGISARWKGFSAQIAPILFRAENSSFRLMPNQEKGKLQFADGQFAQLVDKPQRFGPATYQQIDFGESGVSVEGLRLIAGISTSSQAWGPSDQFQFVLGHNAGGFPHIFAGSAAPLNVGVARIHARVLWGILEQSAFSSVGGPQYFVSVKESGRKRFASGMIVTVQPRGATGLEVGAARFFHSAWRDGGPIRSDFTSLFQNLFKRGLPVEEPLPGNTNRQGVRDNQLFSVFSRWALPGTGFEVYGEYGREDHSYDIRDFFQEPDHGGASRMLGFRKMWSSGYALKAEAINYEEPQLTILRSEGAVYLHEALRQGHTYKGQPLGADAGLGSGAASTVSLDRFTSKGRTAFAWTRAISRETGSFYINGVRDRPVPDVMHTLSFEQLRFRGRADLFGRATLTANLNRYFQSDVFNLGVQLGTSVRF